jgi:hypothetical protein
MAGCGLPWRKTGIGIGGTRLGWEGGWLVQAAVPFNLNRGVKNLIVGENLSILDPVSAGQTCATLGKMRSGPVDVPIMHKDTLLCPERNALP